MTDGPRRLPTERNDRVPKLANTLLQVIHLGEADTPEDVLTALLLVQAHVQHLVMREEGPAGLQRVLVAANERKKRYHAQKQGNEEG